MWKQVAAGVFLAGGVAAAATPSVEIELNKLEPVEGACRAYMVFRNTSDSSYASFRLDLVLFGKDGVLAKRLVVEAAPLVAAKTTLKQFDIQGLSCPDLGQVLLNDVTVCRDQGGERADCAAAVKLHSKGDVPFVK